MIVSILASMVGVDGYANEGRVCGTSPGHSPIRARCGCLAAAAWKKMKRGIDSKRDGAIREKEGGTETKRQERDISRN